MTFENPIVLITLITGVLFIVAGLILLKFPPKSINELYGYRTSGSMKNQERWDFAQKYSAKEMIKFGGVLLLFSIPGHFFELPKSISVIIGVGLLLLVVAGLIYSVEEAIKRRFNSTNI